ncbi:UpxY family transcription antiterminator [Mucilaginibacter celer]|uniref:UpxY family transcription antiterminator n=1 Tax=Mucilaginibacter celer TaxID=2305508 RepID=A0A494VMA7_9SPHI|nr:UpxY family transcription antiterminator [Mucilaginibacter celer]AYL95249.1 UpxY family transcription antiterminator [Mucilaginibacter celer]
MITQKENKNWLVLYTRSRWEKKVDRLLKEQNIESFCPLVKTRRQWVDRAKLVDIPLFPSYLFVRIKTHEQSKIIQTSGAVNFITYCGKPAVIQDAEIERIRMITKHYPDVKTISLTGVNIGDHVTVVNGPLINKMGEIISVKGQSVVMVIKNINCALTIKTDHSRICLAE